MLFPSQLGYLWGDVKGGYRRLCRIWTCRIWVVERSRDNKLKALLELKNYTWNNKGVEWKSRLGNQRMVLQYLPHNRDFGDGIIIAYLSQNLK